MAETVQDFLQDALQIIGALGSGETAITEDLAFSKARANDLIDDWKAERLTIFVVVRSVYVLTSGKGAPGNPYTIGVGGDFDQARPVWIDNVGVITNFGLQNEFELPLELLSDQQDAAIGVKRTPSSLPTAFYYDYQFPLGNILFWPVPSVGGLRVAIYAPTPLGEFVNLSDTVVFPPGYRSALLHNLALRLCPGFSRPVDPAIAQLAKEGMARVERANTRFQRMSVDEALLSRRSGSYNWLNDNATPR